MQNSGQDKRSIKLIHPYSSTLWMCLIGVGFVFELTGRLIGVRDNPLGFWLDFAPLLTTIVAAVLVLYAVFKVIHAWNERNLGSFRHSLLTLLLGSSMLVSSMVCKTIVNILF